MKNILFRVDASNFLGSGHVYRCLELQKILQSKKKYKIEFLTADFTGNLISFLKKKKIKVNINKLNLKLKKSNFRNKKNILAFENLDIIKTKKFLSSNKQNILILDSKYLSSRWEKNIRPLVDHLLVINNYHEKKRHYCDTLFDPNLLSIGKTINKNQQILDPRKFIIFYKKKIKKKKDNKFFRVLINFGSLDSKNLTLRVLKILNKLNNKELLNKIKFIFISGKLNKNFTKIKKICEKKKNYLCFKHIENFRNKLNSINLSIGSSGHSFVEKLLMEIPTLIITSNSLQKSFARSIKKKKLGIYLGHFNKIKDYEIEKQIISLINNKKNYFKLKKNIKKFIANTENNYKNWQRYISNI